MLGGLIAGALGGGAQAVSGIADQVIKEAEQAKKQAYDKGLLEWKLEEGRKDAETEREFRVGNTVLDNQMRAEEAEKARGAAAEQAKLQRDFTANENAKSRSAANAPRPMSEVDRISLDITKKRNEAILNDDFGMVKKYNMMLGLKESDTEKYQIKERKGGVTGEETLGYDLVSPNGYRPIPMIGAPTVPAQSTNPQSKVPWANTYAK